MGTLVSTIWIKCNPKTSPGIQQDKRWKIHVLAVLGHLVGNLATNASFAAMNSCITMMIKACEPMFTMLIHYGLFSAAPSHTISHLASVPVICAGAILFIASDMSFNVWGIGAAILSNVAFPMRNIAAKASWDSDLCTDGPLQGYASMSMNGFLVILPFVLLKLIITHNLPFLEPAESFVSSASHVIYNIASLNVLEQVLPLTHAILNLSKRIIVILANIIYFRTPFTTAMCLGVFVFLCGNLLYLFATRHVNIRTSLFMAICASCLIHVHGTNWDDKPQRLSIMTSWVSDRHMPRAIAENIQGINQKYPSATITVYCGTSQCVQAITNLNNSNITPEFLVIGSVVKETPLASWFNWHAFYKVLAGVEFEDHLQSAVQLGLLWHFGGIYVDPGTMMDSLQLSDNHNHPWTLDDDFQHPWVVDGERSQTSVEAIQCGILDFSYFPSHNNFIHRLAVNFVKLYQKYSRNSTEWPVQFDIRESQWGLYRQCSENCPESRSAKLKKIPLSKAERIHYGTLDFDKHVQEHKSLNFGDPIQSYPGLQILPFVDTFLERDDLSRKSGDDYIFTIFFNAFWNLRDASLWPPQYGIKPILLSMHTSPRMKSIVQKHVDYMTRNGPIGCRDMDAYNFFQSVGVPVYFSACLTLMLQNPYNNSYRTNNIYLVDVDDKFKRFIPQYILDRAISVRHRGHMPNETSKWYDTPMYDLDRDILESRVGRFAEAHRFLDMYAKASLVITQRIHAALPSVALGTPVVFISSSDMVGAVEQRTNPLTA